MNTSNLQGGTPEHLDPSGAAGKDDIHMTVLVSGRPKHVDKTTLTYQEVVRLYAPDGPFGENIVYTVDYLNGPPENPEGSMVEGQSVVVRNGMRFNVARTDKS